jgi:putative CocE/NonD family hydrolase
LRRIIVVGIVALLILLASSQAIIDGVANAFFLPTGEVRPATHSVQTTRGHDVVLDDGVTLSADLHRPSDTLRAPTILVRLPFTDTLFNRMRSDAIGRFWAARGYNVVVQGTRGRYRSGGAFEPLVHERADGIATLRWLDRQPWHDGRLAMWGGSAFGHTQWSIIDQTDAAPDAYFIQIASSRFREMFHPGGAFALESALYWTLNSHGPTDRTVDYENLDRGVRMLPVIKADDAAAGVNVPFFDAWANEAADGDYWRRANGADDADGAAAPVLLLGGWYDPFLPSMLADWQKLHTAPSSGESRLIIGPFAHATTVEWPGARIDEPYRQASVAPALAWFDAQLGVGESQAALPRVRIFVLGENVWRNEEEWPLARTAYTPFRLGPDGLLTHAAQTEVLDFEHFTYDPSDPVPTAGGAMLGARGGVAVQAQVNARSDVLSFLTNELPQALEITGPVRAVLTVSTDAPSTDFTAKLVLARADGVNINLADGIARRGYVPGERTEIEIDMGAISVLAPAGARLRLDISSSNFPRFDRNPNTGESSLTATRFRRAEQQIWRGAGVRSELILPIIPR